MIDLDHLVLPVSDLDGAADRLEQAGFVVTPRADHPFGTANRLIVFADVYVELICVADPSRVPETGFARDVAEHLRARRSGFSHFACRADSAVTAGEAVRALGKAPGEPMWFSRPAPRSDGSALTAAFTLLPIETEPSVFFCVHHTPSAIWFRPHIEHSNGVRRVEAVVAESPPLVLGLDQGPNRIEFDRRIAPVVVSGVAFG